VELMKGMSEERRRTVRLGGYSALLILAAIAVAVVVNILVAKLPSSVTNVDLTSQGLYSLSDETRDLVSDVDTDVTLYLIAQTGGENQAIAELLSQYDALSGRVHVTYVDPTVQPAFVGQYSDTELAYNSVIAVSEKRSRAIPYGDIVVNSYSYNPSTGSYSTTSSFDGENQITSAIDYVTSDYLPVLYAVTGHGEADMSVSLLDMLAEQNMEVRSLNLLTVDAIPEDAACVCVNAPMYDFTEEDAAKLTAYLQSGGSLVLTTFWQEEGLPVLEGVMEGYGLTLVPGIVMDGDSGHVLYGYPHYLLPDYGTHEITQMAAQNGFAALYPSCQGIETAAVTRDTLTITPLLRTSAAAYSKVNVLTMETYEREDGDIDGPFDLAVAVEDSKFGGRVVWFTSYLFGTDDANALVSGTNFDILLASFNWTCRYENSIGILAKDVATQYLNINTADGRSLTIFFMAVLPLAAIITGAVVLFKRKKR